MKINKKSKGYILTEVLIGSILQAVFIVSLAASVYWLTMFSVRTHYLLLAREKGQRIVAHIDSRIKNCGYGLWRCLAENKLRESLDYKEGRDEQKPSFSIYESPIRIFPSGLTQADKNDNPQCGVEFSILYAQPSGLFIRSQNEFEGQSVTLEEGTKSIDYKTINMDFSEIDFNKNSPNYEYSIKSWGVIPDVGIPFYIEKFVDQKKPPKREMVIKKFFPSSATLPPVTEIIYLKDEKFYVYKTDDVSDFCYEIMNQYYTGRNSYVNGVLRIFCEWYENEKIFNLYILTSGGERPIGMEAQEKPNNWSKYDTKKYRDKYDKYDNFDELYESTFKNHIFYVTRASWKLHNIP